MDDRAGPVARAFPTLLAAALFAALLGTAGDVAAGRAVALSWEWVPALGIELAFRIDGLSLTFGLLITGIGALVTLYSQSYLDGDPQYRRFALYLTSFMLAMLGLVLADDVISLFVFWELTSVTSYLLIGYKHGDPASRRAALQALLVTGMGGLALLAGLLLLGQVAGTYSISGMIAADGVRESALYLPILILVLLGAFTKSAQFPFQFWLPNAMAAPTPVSAYLHSATMVKGGVYLMARMHPALSGTDAWLWSLTAFGGFTALYASVMAVRQTDMKQVLAWTTVMALGTLTLLLGDGTGYAATAFAVFLVTHALYKAALFLVAGLVDHGTGTRELPILGGLGRAMPVTALAAALAGLSMAGIPPFVGFIAKELIYAGAEESTASTAVVVVFTLGANALMVAVALMVAWRPFWRGSAEGLPHAPHEGPFAMWLGPMTLAALGLAIGLAPWLVQESLIAPIVGSVLGDAAETKQMKLWAGVNLPLYLSLATFALGAVLYAVHERIRSALPPGAGIDLDRGWDGFLGGVSRLAGWQTRLLQSGSLHAYLFISFSVLVAVAGLALWTAPVGAILPEIPDMTLKAWAVAFLPVMGAGVTILTRSRITAIAGLGVVGIGIALLFIVYGAPDVAITQLLVETLVVVLVALAALRLPSLPRDRVGPRRVADGILAAAVGLLTTVAVLAVLTVPLDLRLTEFFEAASWPEAFGRNIVNVILVDFRALDTFGEIAVVLAAALGAYALLRQKGAR